MIDFLKSKIPFYGHILRQIDVKKYLCLMSSRNIFIIFLIMKAHLGGFLGFRSENHLAHTEAPVGATGPQIPSFS